MTISYYQSSGVSTRAGVWAARPRAPCGFDAGDRVAGGPPQERVPVEPLLGLGHRDVRRRAAAEPARARDPRPLAAGAPGPGLRYGLPRGHSAADPAQRRPVFIVRELAKPLPFSPPAPPLSPGNTRRWG